MDTSAREHSLDVLRGYAALAVVIAHTTIVGLYNVEPQWSLLKWSPLRILWSGHQAVILFFVLSGFALARMIRSTLDTGYFAYLASRVMRLYPPYVASVLLALAVYLSLKACGVSWSPGHLNLVAPLYDARTLLEHASMIVPLNANAINPPIWSIVHEMRISIAFPLILIGVMRFRWPLLAAFVLYSTGLAIWSWDGQPTISWRAFGVLSTVHYAGFFALGAVLSECAESTTKALRRLTGLRLAGTWFAAVALYAYPFENAWSPGQRIAGDMAIGVGAILLMALMLARERGGKMVIGQWLGKVSYSLYLNHALVLNAAILLFHGRWPAPALWVVTICGSLFLAAVMNACVERPSQRASRSLRNALRRRSFRTV